MIPVSPLNGGHLLSEGSVYPSRVPHNIQDHEGHLPAGMIIPENPVRPRRVLLSIGLEYPFPVGTFQAVITLALEAVVAGIGLEELQGLGHRLERCRQGLVPLEMG